MANLSKSPDRGSFNRQSYEETLKVNPEDKEALDWLEYYKKYDDFRRNKELEPEWQKDNLEYDLRTNSEICQRVKDDEFFAQNLYAALCNNEFIKNQPWNILQEKTWSCSWRYAGGILADMCEKGDYIDFYCSGIRGEWSDEEYSYATKEEQDRYQLIKEKHVGEGHITDEVRNELFKLGWIAKENNDSDYI